MAVFHSRPLFSFYLTVLPSVSSLTGCTSALSQESHNKCTISRIVCACCQLSVWICWWMCTESKQTYPLYFISADCAGTIPFFSLLLTYIPFTLTFWLPNPSFPPLAFTSLFPFCLVFHLQQGIAFSTTFYLISFLATCFYIFCSVWKFYLFIFSTTTS